MIATSAFLSLYTMNSMKNYILYGTILLLFLLNGWQLFGRLTEQQSRPPNPKEMIIAQLDFDETQIKAYESLIHEHRNEVRSVELKLMSAKTRLYKKGLLSNEASENGDFSEVTVLYQNLEQAHLQHFTAVKALCSEEQLSKFEELIPKLAEFFRPKPLKNKMHP